MAQRFAAPPSPAELDAKRTLVRQLARWLRRVHDLGIYHDDWSAKNILAAQDDAGWHFYLLDYESLDANLAYAYGLSDTFELEVEYEQRWRFGGAMDGFIESFHNTFGLGQSGRDEWPRNQCTIVIDPGDGSRAGFEAGDVPSYQAQLIARGAHAFLPLAGAVVDADVHGSNAAALAGQALANSPAELPCATSHQCHSFRHGFSPSRYAGAGSVVAGMPGSGTCC